MVLMGTSARASVISTFDTDADGWTTFQNPGAPFGWLSSGGNPDGHLFATDKSLVWAYVQAPAKFLAPAPYGGAFSFDLRVDNLETPVGFPAIFSVRAGLQGAGFTLINEGGLPTTSWKNYSFTLDETSGSGWRKFSNLDQPYVVSAPLASQAEMQLVLANLTRIVIASDYTANAIDNNIPGAALDTTHLDNVQIASAAAVPEPTSITLCWVLLCAGLGYCVLARIGWITRGLPARVKDK